MGLQGSVNEAASFAQCEGKNAETRPATEHGRQDAGNDTGANRRSFSGFTIAPSKCCQLSRLISMILFRMLPVITVFRKPNLLPIHVEERKAGDVCRTGLWIDHDLKLIGNREHTGIESPMDGFRKGDTVAWVVGPVNFFADDDPWNIVNDYRSSNIYYLLGECGATPEAVSK